MIFSGQLQFYASPAGTVMVSAWQGRSVETGHHDQYLIKYKYRGNKRGRLAIRCHCIWLKGSSLDCPGKVSCSIWFVGPVSFFPSGLVWTVAVSVSGKDEKYE
ncbi:hypothetical protein E2C01_042809 [Portunus trituberculatus]|uniref:Uncharacterized protein n=1 Tax=Portunus trituberculatus TaxID=210409 RepID=A0A5B7FNI9_PORTR|nr:hypothetical protein [Portunus trituberculatus]